MTIEKSVMEGLLSPFISTSEPSSPVLEKDGSSNVAGSIAGSRSSSTSSDCSSSSSTGSGGGVNVGGRSRLKRKNNNRKTGESTSSPSSPKNNSSKNGSVFGASGASGASGATSGGSGGSKKPRINIDSVVKQFTSSVNVTTLQQRMGAIAVKQLVDEGNKRLKLTERTNLSPPTKKAKKSTKSSNNKKVASTSSAVGPVVGVDATTDVNVPTTSPSFSPELTDETTTTTTTTTSTNNAAAYPVDLKTSSLTELESHHYFQDDDNTNTLGESHWGDKVEVEVKVDVTCEEILAPSPPGPEPPVFKKPRAKRKTPKVMPPRKRSKNDDTPVGLRKSMRLLVKSNRSKASRTKRAPCPGSPFERTVELLSTSELDRECEVTKILFLSSLNVIPNFARPAPEDKVGSLKTQCIRAHIKHLNSLKERKDRETRKTLPSKVYSDDEFGSSSGCSISSCEIESTPSDREDEEEWMNLDESMEHLTVKESPKLGPEELESNLKDCVTKLLRRGNFVNFVDCDTPPYLEEIIRTLTPKVEECIEDDGYEWISLDESFSPMKDVSNEPLKKSTPDRTPRKARVNRLKTSSSYARISTAVP